MGWLDEREISYLYKTKDGKEHHKVFKADREPPKSIKYQGEKYEYTGLLPDKFNIMVRTQFERNGRIAYKYDHGNGKPYVRSATREQYEHAMGNMSPEDLKAVKEKKKPLSDFSKTVYTKSFEKAYTKAKADVVAEKLNEFKKITKGR